MNDVNKISIIIIYFLKEPNRPTMHFASNACTSEVVLYPVPLYMEG